MLALIYDALEVLVILVYENMNQFELIVLQELINMFTTYWMHLCVH